MSTTPILDYCLERLYDPLHHELERLYAKAEQAERMTEYVNKLGQRIACARAILGKRLDSGSITATERAVLAELEGAIPETKPCDWSYRILDSKFPCGLPYGHSGAHLYGSGAAGEWVQNQT